MGALGSHGRSQWELLGGEVSPAPRIGESARPPLLLKASGLTSEAGMLPPGTAPPREIISLPKALSVGSHDLGRCH